MIDVGCRLPNEVASQLQISPSTLRRWSNEFADYLSDGAGRPQAAAGGQTAHRRYNDEDLEALMTIKGLLAEGQTYIQVAKRLEALRRRQQPAERTEGGDGTTTLGPSLLDSSPIAPAVTVLADTLHTVAEGQQLLLGSQQANREVLSVVLQDNFNLKEENAKLRDRMLELERDMAEIRRVASTRSETLETRLLGLEQQLQQPQPQPQPQRQPQRNPATNPKSSQRSGCLGQIFG
jgi:DNA-binding transcriptional MerR regulator